MGLGVLSTTWTGDATVELFGTKVTDHFAFLKKARFCRTDHCKCFRKEKRLLCEENAGCRKFSSGSDHPSTAHT